MFAPSDGAQVLRRQAAGSQQLWCSVLFLVVQQSLCAILKIEEKNTTCTSVHFLKHFTCYMVHVSVASDDTKTMTDAG